MAAGALQHVALGYQLLWNAQRQIAGVQLCLDTLPGIQPHTHALLAELQKLWSPLAPPLLLSTPHPTLLMDLLEHTPSALARVEVLAELLSHPALPQYVQQAQKRGLRMVWRGQPGERPLPAWASCFSQNTLNLTAEEALQALRASLRRPNSLPGLRQRSPVREGQIYDGIASQALAEHCLDEQAAAALLGWPMEDVLYSYRQTHLQPDQEVILKLIDSIDADNGMDEIEHRLGQDPLLSYRFLRYINSASLGLPQHIDSLRQGLMVLGLSRTKQWLLELLHHASSHLNLQPVRQAMVLRARFMTHLLDTGQSEALKRELYLCGLLSQIDLLVFQSMPGALRAMHLPHRVKEALLTQDGPYWPYLDIAMAVEMPRLDTVKICSLQHGFNLQDINLALLHTLATLKF